MTRTTSIIRCRVVACPEPLDDGNAWSFYFCNDNDFALDDVVLRTVGTEWGDQGHTSRVDVPVGTVAPMGFALIWREGDKVEFRLQLILRLQALGRSADLSFEFPKLYTQRNLRPGESLGKAGFQVEAASVAS